MPPLHPYIGTVFRFIREDLNMSQAEIADKAGKNRTDYSRFERGVYSTQFARVELYANAIGVPLSKIVKLAELLRDGEEAERRKSA